MTTAERAPDQCTPDLPTSIRASLTSDPRRPLLHHLNADSSWLLQIPRPAPAYPSSSPLEPYKRRKRKSSRREGSYWYNILIDPWLAGSQIDFHRWFSQQWHQFDSACQDIQAVEALIGRVETLTEQVTPREDEDVASDAEDAQTGHERPGKISLVLVSHEFTDHCHRETLLQIDPNVPVFATTKAASIISGLKHFKSVTEVPHFFGSSRKAEKQDLDWRTRSRPPLPEWLSISRLVTDWDPGYLHSAVMVAFNFTDNIYEADSASNAVVPAAEAVIYTPHGIPASSMRQLKQAKPPIRTIALLHGLFTVSITKLGTINLGARNGLEVQRLLGAKYWMRTHDEDKRGEGLIGWLMKKKKWTVEQAVKEYERNHDDVAMDSKPRFLDLKNGESMVLA